MQVIIPLAGFGTRLRPHTFTKPKPLINVGGKAVLGHILDKFADMDVDDFIIVHGYLGAQIQDYMAQHYPQYHARFVEQTELVGQADAILRASPFVNGPVLIVFVDTLFEVDLSSLNKERADGIIYVKEVDDPRRFGVAVLGPDGFIARFVEKPESMDNRLAIIGMYYVKDSAALMEACRELMNRNIQTKGEYFLADALNLMIERGVRLRTQAVDVWEDCGKPETVLHTNRYLLEHGHDNSAQHHGNGFLVVPPVHIAASAQIENSIIGPYATISADCRITGSIIRDSIIDECATIEDAQLDQSLIGKDTFVKGRHRKLNMGDSSSVDFS